MAMADVVQMLPRWTQQDWMADAACKGRTRYFFPPHGEQAEARERREAVARSVCMTCPVILECREYARRNREQGYWGGENDEQRVEARRRARTRSVRPAVVALAAEA